MNAATFPSWDTSTLHFLTIVVDAHERLLANPLFGKPLFSDFYFRFGLGKSQAFFSIEKNDKRAENIILYVSRMKIRWVIGKGIEVNSKRSVPNDRTDALCV